MPEALATTIAPPPPTAPSRSSRRGTRRLLGLAAAVCTLLVAVLLSVAIGSAMLPLDVVWQALTAPDGSASHATVSGARVDRTLLGIVVGMSLGVAGALMQALTRNPLADPGVLGVNAGAGFAVTLGVAVFGVTRIEQYLPFAFIGAVAGAAMVYLAASGGRAGPSPLRLTRRDRLHGGAERHLPDPGPDRHGDLRPHEVLGRGHRHRPPDGHRR